MGSVQYRFGKRAFTDNKTLEKVLHYLSPLWGGRQGGVFFFNMVVTRKRLENGNGLSTTTMSIFSHIVKRF